MIWFAVWTTLVLATLAGAALLGQRLWRSGKALLAQLHETGEVLDRLQDRIDELERARTETDHVPDLVATDEQRARWRAVRATNRERREERRRRRRAATYARWRDAGLPS